MRRFFSVVGVVLITLSVVVYFLSRGTVADHVTYGVSFSVPYAKEIGLDWKQAYRAMLSDLGIRHVRLSAYWSEVEPEKDHFAWGDLDFQVSEAQKRNADVILGIGRRLPRWPECHVPGWAKQLSWEEQKEEVRAYMTATIERYKNNPSILYWQVENEPYLKAFANSQCGDLDKAFLKEGVALVHVLDSRPILMTDGGNFGLWAGAYRTGDVFGTSVYLYFWRPDVGTFRTILPASYYRVKASLMRLLFGEKPIILSELSLEPWLAAHINDVPLEEQLSRMNIDTFKEIIVYARETRLDTQYLWGVEWWYYMRDKGHPEFWDAAKKLYSTPTN